MGRFFRFASWKNALSNKSRPAKRRQRPRSCTDHAEMLEGRRLLSATANDAAQDQLASDESSGNDPATQIAQQVSLAVGFSDDVRTRSCVYTPEDRIRDRGGWPSAYLEVSIGDDSEVPPGEGELPPSEGEVPPVEGEAPPDDGEIPPVHVFMPDDGEIPRVHVFMPDDGDIPPDNGELPPDNGELPPDNGELPPDNGELPPDNGELPPDNGELPPDNEVIEPPVIVVDPGWYPIWIDVPTQDDDELPPVDIPFQEDGSASQSGAIDFRGDADVYRFVASVTGYLTITQNAAPGSQLDSYLYLCDAEGNVIASNDDSGGTLNSRLTVNVTAGVTYFIRAAAFSSSQGEYVLDFSTLSLNDAPQIAFQENGSASQSGAIDFGGDADVYRFVASVTGYLTITQNAAPGSQLDSYLYLCDAEGNVIASNDDSGGTLNSRLTVNVTAGVTYFIRAAAFSSSQGEYVLDFNTLSLNDAPQIAFQENGSASQSGAIGDVTQVDREDTPVVELPGDRFSSGIAHIGVEVPISIHVYRPYLIDYPCVEPPEGVVQIDPGFWPFLHTGLHTGSVIGDVSVTDHEIVVTDLVPEQVGNGYENLARPVVAEQNTAPILSADIIDLDQPEPAVAMNTAVQQAISTVNAEPFDSEQQIGSQLISNSEQVADELTTGADNEDCDTESLFQVFSQPNLILEGLIA